MVLCLLSLKNFTISSLIVMQNYSKSISMYKSKLQYGEILVRSYRYGSYVCTPLANETTQNKIKKK